MRDCVRWSIQNKNKVPLLLLRKILYIQKPCLTLPARHGFWTKSNPFPYRPCRNWRSRKNSKKLWFYEVLSLFTQPNGFIVRKSFPPNLHAIISVQILSFPCFPILHNASYYIREKRKLLSNCCLRRKFVVSFSRWEPFLKDVQFW